MTTSTSMNQVMVVDDEEPVRAVIAKALRKEGFSVISASNGPEALERVAQEEIDVMILDIRMPGMDGIEVLRRMNEEHPNTMVIMLTAIADKDSIIQADAMWKGAYAFLTKPCKLKDIRETIHKALDHKENFWDLM